MAPPPPAHLWPPAALQVHTARQQPRAPFGVPPLSVAALRPFLGHHAHHVALRTAKPGIAVVVLVDQPQRVRTGFHLFPVPLTHRSRPQPRPASDLLL